MQTNPPFEIPTKRPQQWTSDTVIPFVKSGIVVELSTIPLYLYAMYSIKPEYGGIQARAELRGSVDAKFSSSTPLTFIVGVVQQEMLHVALTGNLLSSLNGALELYNYSVIPQFPGRILVGKINMDLTGATKENIDCFLRVRMFLLGLLFVYTTYPKIID